MQKFLNTHFLVAVHFLILAVTLSFAAWVAHSAKAETKSQIQESVDIQIATLQNLAELTDRNGADVVIEKVIVDCPKRREFEQLLINLENLPHRDIITLQQLFESCGAFYSERKSLMVSKLQREFEILQSQINLVKAIDSKTEYTQVSDWETLIELEVKRSDLMTELTQIQEDIIQSLLIGNKTNTKAITDLASKAGELNEMLGVLDKQIDALRSTISA